MNWSAAQGQRGVTAYKTPGVIALVHGIVERAFYTSAIILGKPEAIAVWLGFRAIVRHPADPEKPIHIPGAHMYLTGTALSVAFGVLDGEAGRKEDAP